MKQNLSKTLATQESCGKPFGLPNKVLIATINALKDNKVVKCDFKSISDVFQLFFVNMTETLLEKLSHPPDKYGKQILQRFRRNR